MRYLRLSTGGMSDRGSFSQMTGIRSGYLRGDGSRAQGGGFRWRDVRTEGGSDLRGGGGEVQGGAGQAGRGVVRTREAQATETNGGVGGREGGVACGREFGAKVCSGAGGA